MAPVDKKGVRVAVTWQKQACALALAAWGIGLMAAQPGLRHALSMGAYLLIAWLEAFVPRAPLFQPLRKKPLPAIGMAHTPRQQCETPLVAMGSFALMVSAIFIPE